jgi:hypothetical protein
MQGMYLHRTTQTQNNVDTPTCLKRDSKPRSQCSNGRRPYIPQTARPLGPAVVYIVFFNFFGIHIRFTLLSLAEINKTLAEHL